MRRHANIKRPWNAHSTGEPVASRTGTKFIAGGCDVQRYQSTEAGRARVSRAAHARQASAPDAGRNPAPAGMGIDVTGLQTFAEPFVSSRNQARVTAPGRRHGTAIDPTPQENQYDQAHRQQRRSTSAQQRKRRTSAPPTRRAKPSSRRLPRRSTATRSRTTRCQSSSYNPPELPPIPSARTSLRVYFRPRGLSPQGTVP